MEVGVGEKVAVGVAELVQSCVILAASAITSRVLSTSRPSTNSPIVLSSPTVALLFKRTLAWPDGKLSKPIAIHLPRTPKFGSVVN